MIRTVSSTLPSFKSLTFGSGLNILLADVAEKSTDRHTRNSAGKTSLVEIIHFLLGSDTSKSSLFKHEALINHSFSVEFLLSERWVRVTRSGSCEEMVTISSADASALGLPVPISLFGHSDDDQVPLEIDTWKAVLGKAWFDLPTERVGTQFDGKAAPTFRSLVGYFARRRKDGGLDTIEKSSREQQPGSWQVSISYLLGLDWQIARAFQGMRDRKKGIEALTKAVKTGEFGQIIGTTAEIRPELARLEERIEMLRKQVDTFQVHDSYRDLANRASALKDRIGDITFELAEAESAVEYLSRSIEQEEPPAYADVERLYAAAGVELPGIALRRFADVKAFQSSVAANRRRYLQEQIDDLTDRRKDLDEQLKKASAERTAILRSLDGTGAFEDLIRLRENLGEVAGQAEALRTRLQNAVMLESSRTQLKAEAAELELKLQQSYEEYGDAIKRATVLVDHAISKLYDDRNGNLIIEASRTGPKFRIDIQGGGNKGGIDMMKLYCFDTALLGIAFDQFRPGPRLLVHDSHLFDGVDSRQVARALVYGQHMASEVGGQYIVALNSDEFEKADAASDIPLSAFQNPVKLTDDENGGLFGFRFDLE